MNSRRVGGVYRIVAPDGQFYVGSSAYIKQRWSQHIGALRSGKHGSRKMQRCADTWGVESLRLEVLLCALDKAALPEFEQAFIDELKPALNTFRRALCGMHIPDIRAKAVASIKESAAHKEARIKNQRIACAKMRKRIVRLTDGAVFESSYEAARATGIGHIDSVATSANKGWMCGGHYWAWDGSGITLEDRVRAAAAREAARRANSTAVMTEARRKAVVRLSDGAEFPSIAEAGRQINYSHAGISRALKTGGMAAGSRWSYVAR